MRNKLLASLMILLGAAQNAGACSMVVTDQKLADASMQRLKTQCAVTGGHWGKTGGPDINLGPRTVTPLDGCEARFNKEARDPMIAGCFLSTCDCGPDRCFSEDDAVCMEYRAWKTKRAAALKNRGGE